ncbi:MAG TPA: DUF177 domain-containing protein [Candidatus Sulfomarinibacteraceae bacterium]|nr:DUF177 domain-containing protein [Candidatus Sulfomarinibacteraceae bacterium]
MKEKQRLSRLRFNFGHLLDGELGVSRDVELDYPTIQVGDDVTLTPLRGRFRATRTSRGIYLEGDLNSIIETECTRCLEAVALPIEFELDDLFYHPASAAPPGEYAVKEDGVVDLAPLIRELSLLAVPMQVYCQEACKGICEQCGQNLNEGTCDCEVDDIDPRLAGLQALLEAEDE